jgi:hypothetical protein
MFWPNAPGVLTISNAYILFLQQPAISLSCSESISNFFNVFFEKSSFPMAGVRQKAGETRKERETTIEIVSKVILRHADLSTTQRYLGKVNDSEAIRWIETLYG